MKEKLHGNHVLVQMDFSENYCCQNLEEIQNACWNTTVVTLHPTLIYKKYENGEMEHQSVFLYLKYFITMRLSPIK